MKEVRKTVILSLVLVFALSFMVMGCNPPKEEMRRAENALADARDAGAMEWARADYLSAERLLNDGKDLMSNLCYKKARNKFIEAAERAAIAKQNALAAQRGSAVATGGDQSQMPGAPQLPTNHIVKKGECLWWISEYTEIYNDPFQWPLIYQANRDQIRDPDLIYPNQNFKIQRNATLNDVKSARKKAGAPAPYLPPGY